MFIRYENEMLADFALELSTSGAAAEEEDIL